MRRWLKILAIAVAIVVVLLAISYIAIRAYLTPARIRYIASRVASEAIQHPVEFGSVGLRIGFTIGITIDDVSVPNVEGFPAETMVQIDRTALNLKLFPLLRQQIVIGSITLAGLDLNLERNEDGMLNVAAIVPQEMKGTGWSLSLSSLDISNGNVVYHDAKENREIRVKGINQRVSFSGNNIVLSGRQEVFVAQTQTLPEMVLKIDNSIAYDTAQKNITVNKLNILYDPISVDIAGVIENMKTLRVDAHLKVDRMSKMVKFIPTDARPEQLKGALKADLSILGTLAEPKIDGRCELRDVAITPKGMNRAVERINGSLSFDKSAIKNIVVQGKIGSTTFDVTGSVSDLQNPLLNIVTKIDGNLRDFESMTDEFQKIKMSGPVAVRVTVKGSVKNPSYFGDYTIQEGHIDGIGLSQPISNLNVKGSIQNDAAKIDRCSGHIGRSDFSLTGHISGFKQPVVQITNTSNIIDLDELLPTPQKSTQPETKPLPLTLQGTVTINTLSGMDMEFKNINTHFTYENGIIDVRNCKAETFDGEVRLDFHYDAHKPEPYRISTRMESMSAKKILQRFLKFDNLEGRLSGMSNFQGRGLSQKDVISNLSASGNLKITSGTFKNFLLTTRLLSWLGITDQKELKFNDIVTYFKITNGKATINDWAMASSVGNFLTSGTIDLTGNLNLDITTTLSKHYSDIVKKYHGDWLLFFDDKGRALVDINVGGTLKEPRFSLDKSKIQQRLKGKIKDEFDKKKKEWEDKLKDFFKGG
jgi:uncharacterized protein involved in outer membrane biogenesis